MKINNNIEIKQQSFFPDNIKRGIKYAPQRQELIQDTFQLSTKTKEINNADFNPSKKIYSAITQKLSFNPLFNKISFGGANTSEKNNYPVSRNMNNLQELSNKNRKEITKAELLAKLENVDIPQYIKDDITSQANTPEQILLADKFLSEDKLHKNEDFNNRIGRIICLCNTPEKAQIQLDLTDKYIADERLYENKNVQKTIGNIIFSCDTPEKSVIANKFLSAPQFYENPDIKIEYILGSVSDSENTQCKLDIMNKYISEPKLYKNKNIQETIGYIIRSCDTPEKKDIANKFLSAPQFYENPNIQIENILNSASAPENTKCKLDLMNKYISEPKLNENASFQAEIENIVKYCNTPENTQYKLDLMNKYVSEPKLYENEDVQKIISNIVSTVRSKEGIEISDKFLSDEKLYGNGNIREKIVEIIDKGDSPEEAHVKIDLMDKYISDERLYGNSNVNKLIGQIISSGKTPKQAQSILDLTNKYISDSKLYKNSNINLKIEDIIHYCNTPEEAQIKINLMNKYISDPYLYRNKNVQQTIGKIISSCDTPEQSAVADKFLSDNKLYENQNIKQIIGEIIDFCQTPEQSSIANKFLSDEKLYGNYDIQNRINGILNYCDTEEDAQAKVDLMNKYISEPKLYENKSIQEKIGIIIDSREPENTQKKLDLINKYISEPKLYENVNIQETIGWIIAGFDTSENSQIKLDLMNKYLSEPKLYENKNVQERIGDIIRSCRTQEKAQTKLALLNKYLSDSKLHDNANIQETIGDILASVDKKEQRTIADKFLSEPKLYENANIKVTIGRIIKSGNTPEKAQIKIDLMNKYISDEKFKEKPEIQETIGWIITFTPQLSSIENKFLSDKNLYKNKELCKYITDIISFAYTPEKETLALKLSDMIREGKILPKSVLKIISADTQITYEQITELNKTVSQEHWQKLQNDINEFNVAAKLTALYNKKNVNEIPIYAKRNVINEIVKNNVNLFFTSDSFKKVFPLIPRTPEEYCNILPALVKSLGIETNPLSKEQIEKFNSDIKELASVLQDISDDEFKNMVLTQKYSKDNFIKDTLEIIKDLPKNEQQNVCNLFGFVLRQNEKTSTGYTISGYPFNPSGSEKFAGITNPQAKEVIENLKEKVITFTQNNKVSSNIPKIETLLNDILTALPELHTLLDKTQHGAHKFDVMKHSLKVMQKITQNKYFDSLNDSDKKIMYLAALLHDITKQEMKADSSHPAESSFDAFYITKKFNLTQDEQLKLYNLIRNHEWLKYVNKKGLAESETTQRLQSVAFDFQNDNIFKMAKIFTHSDLKSISNTDKILPAFKEAFYNYSKQIDNYILELKKTKPILPMTKLPKASEIGSKITYVNNDCSTNIKGLYKKDGLVIIKYNEVEDWEALGFPQGSTSKGIKVNSRTERKEIDTGNIKFIAHGLDYENQLINFDSFALPDSDALLSVSYMERPESKYRLFRPQGVLLDVDSKYIYGGGATDSGSGYKKDISEFKINYTFGGNGEADRKFISNLIKETLNLNDEEYIKFIENNQNKSFLEIEPVETREKLIKQFALINSNSSRGNREYNEMYVSNPKVRGVFAYASNDKVGEISDFIDNQKDFLKKYARTNDLPFFVFGD